MYVLVRASDKPHPGATMTTGMTYCGEYMYMHCVANSVQHTDQPLRPPRAVVARPSQALPACPNRSPTVTLRRTPSLNIGINVSYTCAIDIMIRQIGQEHADEVSQIDFKVRCLCRMSVNHSPVMT